MENLVSSTTWPLLARAQQPAMPGAALPVSVMNSRRLIAATEAEDRASYRLKIAHWNVQLKPAPGMCWMMFGLRRSFARVVALRWSRTVSGSITVTVAASRVATQSHNTFPPSVRTSMARWPMAKAGCEPMPIHARLVFAVTFDVALR